jgi:predicted PurR-regulated permease PerM
VPDKHEKEAAKAIDDTGYLLSRYFIGVMIEVFGVGLLNFLGLLFIARLGINAAVGLAFMTGILNVIPYVGPLMGGVMGTILGLVIKYSSAVPVGLDVSFIAFTLILIAIFSFTQLIDNILYQPLIYSTSIKAKPLEIFIVLLIAGHLAGPLGMIIAIPSYTVVRVVAFRFFRQYKAIRRLIPSEKLITDEDKD